MKYRSINLLQIDLYSVIVIRNEVKGVIGIEGTFEFV